MGYLPYTYRINSVSPEGTNTYIHGLIELRAYYIEYINVRPSTNVTSNYTDFCMDIEVLTSGDFQCFHTKIRANVHYTVQVS